MLICARTSLAALLLASTFLAAPLACADEQADAVENLAVDYLKTGASDPTDAQKLGEAGVDFSIGIVTLGLTSLGVPGVGAALGELKKIFFGGSDGAAAAVASQITALRNDINTLKGDVDKLGSQLNQTTIGLAMTANSSRTNDVWLATAPVVDSANALAGARYESPLDKKEIVDDALNHANTFIGLDVWKWDNVRVNASLASNKKPLLTDEQVPDINLALKPYLESIGVLAAAIDATGIRPDDSKLQPHIDKLYQLEGLIFRNGWVENTSHDKVPDSAVKCTTSASGLMLDDGKCGLTISCASPFATRTKTYELAAHQEAGGTKCIKSNFLPHDWPSYEPGDPYAAPWNTYVAPLWRETAKANDIAGEAIDDAIYTLKNAGKSKLVETFPDSKTSQIDYLFAADDQGHLLKFEHMTVDTKLEAPKPAPDCNPANIFSQCGGVAPPTWQTNHQFAQARYAVGGWRDFSDVVVSEATGDALIVYGIKPQGDLIWRRIGSVPAGLNVRGFPVLEAPHRVGNGWNNLRNIFSTGEGIIYGVAANGDLIWYHHKDNLDPSGGTQWEQRVVRSGWDHYTRLFSPGHGIIYAVTQDGNLLWFKHAAYRTGGRKNEPGAWEGPHQVGTGWGSFSRIFATAAEAPPAHNVSNPAEAWDAHIYAVNDKGELLFYVNHFPADGLPTWDVPVTLANRWGGFTYAFVAMGARDPGSTGVLH